MSVFQVALTILCVAAFVLVMKCDCVAGSSQIVSPLLGSFVQEKLIRGDSGGGGCRKIARGTLPGWPNPVVMKCDTSEESNVESRSLYVAQSEYVLRLLSGRLSAGTGCDCLFVESAEISLKERLSQLEKAGKRMPWGERQNVTLGFLYGLATFHRHGIAHADLKASQLLRMSDGRWKVGDPGEAVSVGRQAPCVPLRNAFLPEYVRSRMHGRQACENASHDVWNLGLTLVRVHTGSNVIRNMVPVDFKYSSTATSSGSRVCISAGACISGVTAEFLDRGKELSVPEELRSVQIDHSLRDMRTIVAGLTRPDPQVRWTVWTALDAVGGYLQTGRVDWGRKYSPNFARALRFLYEEPEFQRVSTQAAAVLHAVYHTVGNTIMEQRACQLLSRLRVSCGATASLQGIQQRCSLACGSRHCANSCNSLVRALR